MDRRWWDKGRNYQSSNRGTSASQESRERRGGRGREMPSEGIKAERGQRREERAETGAVSYTHLRAHETEADL
eukprot:1134047-Rhodomonas_salina.1